LRIQKNLEDLKKTLCGAEERNVSDQEYTLKLYDVIEDLCKLTTALTPIAKENTAYIKYHPHLEEYCDQVKQILNGAFASSVVIETNQFALRPRLESETFAVAAAVTNNIPIVTNVLSASSVAAYIIKGAEKLSDAKNMLMLTKSDSNIASAFSTDLAIKLTMAKEQEIYDLNNSPAPKTDGMIRSFGKATIGTHISDGLLGNDSPIQKLAIKHSKIARDYIFEGKLEDYEVKNTDLAIEKLVSVVMDRSVPNSSPSLGNVRGLQGVSKKLNPDPSLVI